VNEEAMAHWGLSRQKQTNILFGLDSFIALYVEISLSSSVKGFSMSLSALWALKKSAFSLK